MRTIRTKLALLVFTAVGSAVLLVAVHLTCNGVHRSFLGKRLELQGVAAAIATSVAKPLSNRDDNELARTLGAAGRIPGLTFARVTDSQGHQVVQYGSGVVVAREIGAVEPNPIISPLSAFYLATYPIISPIIHGGRQIGELTLIADVSSLRSDAVQSLRMAFGAGLLALALGLLMSWRLQTAIATPLAQLTSTIQDVSRTKDFERKVGGYRNGEIGILVGAFNEMLGEIRARDESLARQRDSLEVEVAQRTRELAEAKREAETANAAKSDFLATMSHEIRTPLNGMLVMAELMAAERLEPKLQRYSQVLLNSSHTLMSIINDVLDLSKIEAGKLELESVPVLVHHVIEDVIQLFSAKAAEQQIELVSIITADVPAVIAGDEVRIRQVLSNLVNNALKFTAAGSVTVRVTATGGTEAIALTMQVIDTGIGIAPEKLGTIFEAFAQADQSTARQFGGTGIGLTICQRLAKAMGGSIGVVSREGFGSTFSVTLPVHILEDASAVRPAVEAARFVPGSIPALAGLRVLAADDNVVNLEVLSAALARLQVEVVCVADGAAAVAEFQVGAFDVVLMDCSMPVMDGFAAARAIREWEAERGRESVPIVALTAHVLGDHDDALRKSGFTSYLSKPFTLKSLMACLTAAAPVGRRKTETKANGDSRSDVSGDLIDLAVVGELLAMQSPGERFVVHIAELYAAHAPKSLAALGIAVSNGTAAEVAAAAHALRSLSLNVGATIVSELACTIERNAMAGDMCSKQLEALQIAVPATVSALTELADGGPSAPPALIQAA